MSGGPGDKLLLATPGPGQEQVRQLRVQPRGETFRPSMRPGLTVVTGPSKTIAQPRRRTHDSTSATDAFSGLGPETLYKGADGCTPSLGRLLSSQNSPTHDALLSKNTPSAKLQAPTTRMARARGTVLGSNLEREAAETSEEEGPQPSYNTSPDQLAQGMVRNKPGEAPRPLMRPGPPLAPCPTNNRVQSRLRAQNMTTPTDAF